VTRSATGETERLARELERVVWRWQQLPLDRALEASPGVSAVVQHLADEVARHEGLPVQPVPDLGPAVLMDQLTVMVHDHQTAGLSASALADELTDVRRGLP